MRAPVGIAFRSAVVAVSIMEVVYPMNVANAVETKRCFVPPLTIHGAPPSVALIKAPLRTAKALPAGNRRSPDVIVTTSFNRYQDERARTEMGRNVPTSI